MEDNRRKGSVAKAMCTSHNRGLGLGVTLSVGMALWIGTGDVVSFPIFLALGLTGTLAAGRKDRSSH